MPTTFRFFRVRIRNAADSADALTVSSFVFDANPYIVEPPTGDGESIDPISGAPTTGSYTVEVADPETATDTRVITSELADVYARQQLIARKAWVEQSEDGTVWETLVVGYITAIRAITAIKFEIAIGQSRRIEASRVVFKEATDIFDGVTCVIGGPVIGGFINDDFLEDHGGWEFEVDENTAVHVKLALTTGFDPRKYAGTFGSTSTAIADYTNDWARNFFEPTDAYGTGGVGDILGYFPGLRARLWEVGSTDEDDIITLIPLARPATGGSGPWWNPGVGNQDKLTGFGTSQLYLPKVDINGDPFSPSLGTDYRVWVYAVAISKDNPLHWFGHPVDLWEQLHIDAGIPYDASVLPAIKALPRIGNDLSLALRIMSSSKFSEFVQKVIYGPFRLSSRIEDGERILISVSVFDNDPPTETIDILDLRSDEGTVFDLDESTVVTDLTLKSQRIIQWTSEDANQPEIDSLISRDAYPQTIENSADDIPGADTEKEETIGDIPGMIWKDGLGPVSIEPFLINLGAEMFDRFGRGAIMCDLSCLPSVTVKVGEEVLLDLIHLPGAVVGESPVSQRNIGPLPFQVIQRTETPEGPELKLCNSISPELAGASIPLAPTFTLEPSELDNERYALDTITNADDLNAASLDVAVYYALSPTEPDSGSGTHFMTVPAEFMTNPTFEFDLGPYDNTEVLWVQMRAEKSGLRPGPFTAWQSVAAATYLTIAGDPMTIGGELAVL